jgi:hypothetical protein
VNSTLAATTTGTGKSSKTALLPSQPTHQIRVACQQVFNQVLVEILEVRPSAALHNYSTGHSTAQHSTPVGRTNDECQAICRHARVHSSHALCTMPDDVDAHACLFTMGILLFGTKQHYAQNLNLKLHQ